MNSPYTPKVKETIEAAQKLFGNIFEIVETGSPIWHRVFVKVDGVQYGRMTFEKGELYYIKYYKPMDYEYDPKHQDELFFQLEYYFETGELIPDFKDIVEKAKKIRETELREKQAWRDAHPIKRRRKRLQGRMIRSIIENIIRERMNICLTH